MCEVFRIKIQAELIFSSSLFHTHRDNIYVILMNIIIRLLINIQKIYNERNDQLN